MEDSQNALGEADSLGSYDIQKTFLTFVKKLQRLWNVFLITSRRTLRSITTFLNLSRVGDGTIRNGMGGSGPLP